jgi:hypothetical protein
MSDSEAALLVVDDIEDNRFALSRRLARQTIRPCCAPASGPAWSASGFTTR